MVTKKLLNSQGYLAWGKSFNEKFCYETSKAKTLDRKRSLLKNESVMNSKKGNSYTY